eukprot:3255085-Rhodomonas_salina.1
MQTALAGSNSNQSTICPSDHVALEPLQSWNVLWNNLPVNPYSQNSKGNPCVAAVGRDMFVVVWVEQVLLGDGGERRTEALGVEVKGQLVAVNGSKIGSEFLVRSNDSDVGSIERNPSAAALGADLFVIAWVSDGNWPNGFPFPDWQPNPETNRYRFVAQIFTLQGEKVGTEFQVNTRIHQIPNDPNSGPTVASIGSEQFVVVWPSITGNESNYYFLDIFAQRFDTLGTKLGSEFRINSRYHLADDIAETVRGVGPAVATVGSDKFVVVWSSSTNCWGTQIPSPCRVVFQLFDSVGEKIGGERDVSPLGGERNVSPVSQPRVAGVGDNHIVIVWHDWELLYRDDGDGFGVFASVFDLSRKQLSCVFLVNTEQGNAQVQPDVAAMGDQMFAVTWLSHDPSSYRVVVQIFNLSGAKVGTEFQVTARDDGSWLGAPSAVALGADHIFFVWASSGVQVFAGMLKSTFATPPSDTLNPAVVVPSPSYPGKVFELFEERLLWQDAEDRCVRLEGHLAIIMDAAEDEALTVNTPADLFVSVLIGINDVAVEG